MALKKSKLEKFRESWEDLFNEEMIECGVCCTVDDDRRWELCGRHEDMDHAFDELYLLLKEASLK